MCVRGGACDEEDIGLEIGREKVYIWEYEESWKAQTSSRSCGEWMRKLCVGLDKGFWKIHFSAVNF